MKTALRLTIAIFAMAALNLTAATLYVALDSPNPTPPYTNWDTAAHVIQDAVDASHDGDTVLVTNGVYAVGGRAVGTNILVNRVAVEKPLALRSVNGPEFTLIHGAKDAAGRRGCGDEAIRCVYLAEGASLSGFTLTNGATRWGWPEDENGGGLWCESISAVISNCVITGNSAHTRGGGVFGGTLHRGTLLGNEATLGGGAFGSTLYDCALVDNVTTWGWGWGDGGLGGGVAECTLYRCTLTHNTADVGVGGGALSSILYDSVLIGNKAAWGGGACSGMLYNCTLTGNNGGYAGGGVVGRVMGWGVPTLINCTLTGNFADIGGGAWKSILYNCTLSANSARLGGGASGSKLSNCIVYYNTASEGANHFTGRITDSAALSGEVSTLLDHCCTHPLPTNGFGNLTGPPLFMDLAGGDFRLREDSPCIDAGTNLMGFPIEQWRWVEELADCAWVVVGSITDPTDILGNTRFIDGDGDGKVAWDIGAYEYASFKPPRFAPQLQPSPNGFQITVTGEPGKSVRIERSTDLLNWTPFATVPIPTGGQTLIDPAAASEPFLFYRAVSAP